MIIPIHIAMCVGEVSHYTTLDALELHEINDC